MAKKGDYTDIPTNKLEKIHFLQINVLNKRRKEGKLRGVQFDQSEVNKIRTFIVDMFKNEIGTIKDNPEDMVGTHIYVAFLNKLPIEKLQQIEIETQKELKKRIEIKRQYLDAGNLKNIVDGKL